jgi:adenine-specific DNA-methyltransferase
MLVAMPRRQQRYSSPACQPALPRDTRRATGVYYTPPEIVRWIVDLTLGPLLGANLQRPLQILDPACGAGEFLVEAQRYVHGRRGGSATAADRLQGMDIDASAVISAQQRLSDFDRAFPVKNIRVADALDDDLLSPAVFDAIVGNPPYVNIRQLAKSLPFERIKQLRKRFQTARGNFDLYVLFIERAIELLRPGGRCGLIVPNKWATLDYARPCRELLLEHTSIEQIIDLSEAKAFDAAVYPHVLIFRKNPPAARHAVQIRDDNRHGGYRALQTSLCAAAIHLTPPLDVEARASTLPLGQIATLSCGTAGYAAQRIGRRLTDHDSAEAGHGKTFADFITSGNIDRYQIRLGRVRYLNRDYHRPRLPLDIPELTAAKRRLFASPKIVIAGMSRRLEAAWDDRGLALGVQVFAAHQLQLDPYYLLALLNSKLISYLFATRYAAKRLSGGYLAINKGQLSQLPIRDTDEHRSADLRRHQRLSELAAMLVGWDELAQQAPAHRGQRKSGGPAAATAALSYSTLDIEIDQLVYQLYRLTSDEIVRVEAHFAQARVAAA